MVNPTPLDDARFRALLALIPEALFICKASGVIVAINPRMEALLGWRATDLVGRPIDMLVPEEARAVHAAHRERFLATRCPHPTDLSRRIAAVRSDGTHLPVEVVLSHVALDGETYVAGTVRDTTERWRIEDALRASDSAIATSVTAIGFARMDGTVDSVNQAFLRLWGYDDRREVLGRKAWSFLADPVTAAPVATALRYHGAWVGELTAIRRNGEHRQIQLSANLIFNAANEPVRMMATVLDLSELRAAQRALELREEQLQAVLANVPVIITAVDLEGRCTLAEGRGLSGLQLKSSDLVGRRLQDVYGNLPKVREAWERARAGESVSFTTDRDGRRFDVAVAPLNTSHGRSGAIGVAFDNTERHLAEQALAASEAQLRQSQKMEAIGQLAGGIAHDFNNLLTVVRGYTDVLLEQFDDNDVRRTSCAEIRRAAERASMLTRQLLAFSRRQMLQPKVLNLNTVVADMQRMLARVIGEDVSLTVSLEPDVGNVKADPGQLEQILVNLALNARDAMPRGGRLQISTATVTTATGGTFRDFTLPAGEWVRLEVADTGHGMDAATLRRIFEPFFTTKNPGQGTGLGLSTVYGIVKQSEGFIDCSSVPGEGTTVQIFLPHATEPLTVDHPPQVQTDRRASGTVLLAEDEEGVRDLARLFLLGAGYEVLVASDGRDALRLATEYDGPIDLLVTDVVMPNMDGPALVSALAPFRPHMKVLYISGYTEDAMVLRGGARNALLLQKPFSKPDLLESVARSLEH